MKCNFNSKILCYELIKNCLDCDINIYTSISDFFEGSSIPEKQKKPLIVICPYCLTRDYFTNFVYVGKSGQPCYNKKCPVCGNILHQSTLIRVRKFSFKELADWIIYYPVKEYWRKCNYELFRKNLYARYSDNDINEFWNEYRRLKPNKEREKEIE